MEEVQARITSAMKAFYSDTFTLPLPPGHRFPMDKYRQLRQAVLAAGLVGADDLRVPPPASDEELLRVHDRDYVRCVKEGTLSDRQLRRIGFPWSPAHGRALAALRAGAPSPPLARPWRDGVAVNLAGGTHHAFADRGEGFCVFNDVAVATRALQAKARRRPRWR